MKLENVKLVGIWTTNPVKINAVKNAFFKLGLQDIEFRSFKAPSGVSDQPIWTAETIKGAYNRAKYCLEIDKEVDIAFWLEWSVDFIQIDGKEKCFLTWWTVAIDRDGIVWYWCWGHVQLPDQIGERLKQGYELWLLMDELLWMKSIKHNQWTVWLLTNWLINRTQAFEIQVIFSLTKWISPLYLN